ncbi:MAG: cupin domain-containing protein [Thermoleophilia bacterium]|nr:cupin domain-containing protein [Thermoleophilia bacterium]MDH5333828.1 cupin domain-containing protein [Thermoleophilia bacterium]
MATERGHVSRLRAVEPVELVPGVTMRPLFGAGAMLNLLEFAPGARVADHTHPHEQLGYVLEGELTLEIDGVEHRLGAGDAYRIAGGTPHAAWSDGPCVVLDVFQPVREDYRERMGA